MDTMRVLVWWPPRVRGLGPCGRWLRRLPPPRPQRLSWPETNQRGTGRRTRTAQLLRATLEKIVASVDLSGGQISVVKAREGSTPRPDRPRCRFKRHSSWDPRPRTPRPRPASKCAGQGRQVQFYVLAVHGYDHSGALAGGAEVAGQGGEQHVMTLLDPTDL